MHIHHLNCGCMCPIGGAFFDGFSRSLFSHLVCHCLLIESDRGLILVDTGFGLRDIEAPTSRLSPFFIGFNNIQFDRKYTAIDQIQKLGFSPRDVRHIVLTHLDFDHAGGLEDFPEATVHVMQREMEAARSQQGFIAHRRYREKQWDDVQHWNFYETAGDPWFGFEAVRELRGLPPEILLVPLIGHTAGHAGIAIQTAEGWMLHAGDAYFYREEMNTPDPRCTPGLRLYQRMMEVNRQARLHNQDRLRSLVRHHGQEVQLFCSHDAMELKAWVEASGDMAAVPMMRS